MSVFSLTPAELWNNLTSELNEVPEILEKAYEFASRAHSNHIREDGTLQICHPLRVALMLVQSDVNDATTLAIALLHDTVEDCGIQIGEIVLEFGNEIAKGVEWLTKTPTSPERAAIRDNWYLTNLLSAPIGVRQVKCADALDNCTSLRDTGDSIDPETRGEMLSYIAQNRDKVLTLALETSPWYHERLLAAYDA